MFKAEHRGRVVRLTMQREPVNAINNEWIAGFNRVLDTGQVISVSGGLTMAG